MVGIYGFQNQINGKWYIGQSIHIERRKQEHFTEMQSNRKNHAFYQALKKYGWDNFTFKILEECTPEQLNKKEIYWISFYDSYKNGYNSTPGGQSKYYDPQLIFDAWDEGLSTSEIADKLNISVSCIKNNLHEYENYSVHEAHRRGGILAHKKSQNKSSTTSRNVYQYDLKGNFIKEWPSCKEIARQTGYDVSVIGKCINGKRRSAYKYQWTDYYKENIPVYKRRG